MRGRAASALMLTQSCVTFTRTLRDNHEAKKLVNRSRTPGTERLLMEVGKPTA